MPIHHNSNGKMLNIISSDGLFVKEEDEVEEQSGWIKKDCGVKSKRK